MVPAAEAARSGRRPGAAVAPSSGPGQQAQGAPPLNETSTSGPAVRPGIRAARSADHDAIVDLWERCGLSRPWIDARAELDLKVASDPDGMLVAGPEEGDVWGTVMAGFDGHRGWVNYLAVEPSRRREGIAVALMQAAEAHLGSRGAPKVNLQVRTSNLEVLAFYAALGYVDDDVVSL
ncbi:MAG: GNAT family acetyltransferase, partial [Acidimicrobiales bacterium]